ncbi:gamma-glutamyl-gamma-aminobutyrate hydrolase family protein [Microbispora sp. NPDC049125]|uniref:gamma-glutamyl-gamma-aminobutyrate hydrolase family protein n=1 Tax=Microbispora sp. NPDC049125 TaxID=3154929 RepID=UPI003466F97C
MRQPLIGVSLRPWRRPGKRERWMQSPEFFTVVRAAGGVPLPIPPMDLPGVRALYDLCDGLLLPGGRDVDPASYGAAAREEETLPDLDVVEIALTRWAAEDGLPLLGVCRGEQIMNVALGGTLWGDVSEIPGAADHGGDDLPTTWHEIAVTAGSKLAKVLGGTRATVNSRHHQAVDRLGEGLRTVGESPDGVIEAIEADGDWFALGVQWHPEEASEHSTGDPLFRALIEAATGPRTRPAA